MPTYEYRRPDGTTFEVQQSFSEDSLTEDPKTGVPVQRVLHAPAVHFKGKGFYNTDYGTRKRQRETAASSEGSSSSDSSSGDSSAADSSGSDSAKGGGADSSSKGDSASKSEGKKSESSSTPAAKSGAKPVAAVK